MTNRLQLCVSPSLTRAHIYDTLDDGYLTLCKRTSRVAAFKGSVFVGVICPHCAELARCMLSKDTLTKDDIGVKEIRLDQ